MVRLEAWQVQPPELSAGGGAALPLALRGTACVRADVSMRPGGFMKGGVGAPRLVGR